MFFFFFFFLRDFASINDNQLAGDLTIRNNYALLYKLWLIHFICVNICENLCVNIQQISTKWNYSICVLFLQSFNAFYIYIQTYNSCSDVRNNNLQRFRVLNIFSNEKKKKRFFFSCCCTCCLSLQIIEIQSEKYSK